MKSVHRWPAAVVLTLVFACSLAAQENSSQILSRPHIAAVEVDPPHSVASHSFPSFSPSVHRANSGDSNDRASKTSELAGPAITMTSSLVVVLALFAGMVWAMRKFGSRSMSQGAIPNEVLHSLGSTPIDARTRITMVRCGHRILILAQTATAVHPLSEITDPDEVRQLSAACLGDSKRAFASTLKSIEREKPDAGYAGAQPASPTPRARGRLFTTA